MKLLKNMKLVFGLLLSLLLLVVPCSISLAETNYANYQKELSRLSQICEKLDMLNNKLKSELMNSKSDLEKLQQELLDYKIELTQLQTQLLESQNTSQQLQDYLEKAQNLLKNSEESFQSYKTATTKQINFLKLQRNTLIVIVLSVLFSK